MKLSGHSIKHYIEKGDIVIDPLVDKHVGPNSVDLTLAPELKFYHKSYDSVLPGATCEVRLDMMAMNGAESMIIPEDGVLLYPGVLYLGMTNEVAGAKRNFVPCIEGRSSVARLGLFVHITAGFGDVGFVNRWTLEMVATHPIRIYPNVRICQIFFDVLLDYNPGAPELYHGKYAERSEHPEPSKLYEDFKT